MKNLSAAIYSKVTGSAFSTSIGGRFYKGRAPQGATWPYAVYYIISDVPDNTFTDSIEDVIVQFTIFSKASGTTEILDIAANMESLFDDSTFSVTGNTLVMMLRTGGNGDPRSVFDDTEGGEGLYWQLDTDYNVILKRN